MGWHHLIVFDTRDDGRSGFEFVCDLGNEAVRCVTQVVGQLTRRLRTPKRLGCILCGGKVPREPPVVVLILPDDFEDHMLDGGVDVPIGCLCEACVVRRTSDQVRELIKDDLRRQGVMTDEYVMSPPTSLQ